MADENKVTLTFEVDSKDFDKAISGIEKSTKKAVESSEKQLSSFGEIGKNVALGFQAAFGFFAAGALVDGIKSFGHALTDAVKSASEADQNLRNVAVAFAQTGEFSDQAVESVEKFASTIQKTTTFSDDAALSAVTLAKSFGLTNDQATQLTAAAVDLAAATGKDLDTAVRELGNTYSGATGKLQKQIPALKDLTSEQLKNGAAIAVVQKAFQDAAKAQAEGTFAGALAKTKNAFDEVFEAVGKIVTQNPVLIAAISKLGEVFNTFAAFVSKNQDVITVFFSQFLKGAVAFLPKVVDGFVVLVQALSVAVEIVANLVKGFVVLADIILEVTKPIRDLQNIVGNALIGAVSKFLSTIARIISLIPGASDSISALGIDLQGLQKDLNDFGEESLNDALTLDTSASDSFQAFAKDALQSVFEVTEGSEESITNFLSAVEEQGKGLSDTFQGISDDIQKVGNSSKKVTAGIKNQQSQASGGFDFSGALNGLTESLNPINGTLDKMQLAIDAIPNILNKVTKIFDSLTELPDKILDATKNLLRAIPRFISEFIPNLFRAIPELIREVLKAFTQTIPDAINELAKALPDLIAKLIQDLEELIEPLITALVTNAPKIMIALVDAFVTKGGAIKIAVSLIKALNNPQLYIGIAKGIIQGLAGLGDSIANTFKAGVANVGKEMGAGFVTSLQSGLAQIGATFSRAGALVYQSIITAFQRSYGQLYSTLIAAFQQILPSLYNTIVGAFTAVYASLSAAINEAFASVFAGFADAGKQIADAFQKPVDDLKNFLNNFSFPEIGGGALGGLGGAGGKILGSVIGGIVAGPVGAVLGGGGGGLFATGGQVPPGFPNDSFPARLTSNELIIPPGDTQRLSSFLDQQSTGGGDTLVASMLSQILLKLSEPISVSTTAEVNGRGLADIMLELSRGNARTSV